MLGGVAVSNASAEPRLVRITPAGEDVESTAQIVFQFDSGVVPVGRMERDQKEIPVLFEPKVECGWRWLNTSTLACQLSGDKKLSLATRYQIEVRPEAATRESEMLKTALFDFLAANPAARSFITQRPRVTSSWFQAWSSPGQPQIYLAFNQNVSASSVREHLVFTTPDGMKVRALVLAATAVSDDEEGGDDADESGSENQGEETKRALPDTPEWEQNYVVMPEHDLPHGSRNQLHVEPGLVGQIGSEKGVEDRVVREFDTFPEFEFRGVRCCDTSPAGPTGDCSFGREITVGLPGSEQAGCNPQERIALVFSSPVRKEGIKDVLQITPDLRGKRADFDPWLSVSSWSRLSQAYTKGDDYLLFLPYGLKANQPYTLNAAASQVRDEFGRGLASDIDSAFVTSKRLPRLVYERGPSVLEKEEKTHLPVVIQNIDALDLQYDMLTAQGATLNQRMIIPVDNAPDVSYHFPLKAREILKGSSGVIKGELSASPPALMGEQPDYFITQVTPFNVHVKLGHFSSLVWVTRLADGSAVGDARISIFTAKMANLAGGSKILAEGTTDAMGLARLPGTQVLDPLLKVRDWWNQNDERPVFKVMVKKGDEMALVPLIYDLHLDESSASSAYFYAMRAAQYGHMRAWGTTAQGIYKLGQPIDFKLYVRHQNDWTLTAAPKGPYTLKVMDPTGKVVFEQKDVELSDFGALSGQFSTSEQGAVGWYRFLLIAKFAPRGREYSYGDQTLDENKFQSWEPMQVLVSDFTPATFKVASEVKGALFHNGDTVKVETQARLHAGGPYVDAPLRLTARIFPEDIRNVDAAAKGFQFNLSPRAQEPATVHQSEDKVDSQGNKESSFEIQGATALYGRLEVESAVRDDRGKYIAARGNAQYAGRDRYVGLKLDGWCHPTNKELAAKMIVVDDAGHVAAGAPVSVVAKYLEVKASRVKGPGNAYLTQYEKEWRTITECKLTSSTEPQECRFVPEQPGSYRVEATVVDTAGRTHVTQIDTYAFGSGIVLWESEDTNRLEIIPEKKDYKVGETARFLVKNPFPGAQALVTIERYGIMKSWLETLKDGSPILEVKITPEHIPGFYLSVVVFSPRVDKPLGEGQVDLGKPAVRQGYAEVAVKDQQKELIVETHTDREVYRPRDTVKVDLQIRTRQGDKPATEIAVAVLDEAVFALLASGQDYYDPYKGFYRLESLDLKNYDLLMQLIGRRKFEKKGANSGGDGGGMSNMRSLFKYVSYWNPSLRPNAQGKVSFSFEAPDNLTGWRILAMAVTATDRMGLGQGNFKVNRETEIQPALPNQVLEGDSFDALFTVMNRTEKERTLKVALEAEGSLAAKISDTQEVVAKPYERYPVKLSLKAGAAGTMHFKVTAGDASDTDGLDLPLKVRKKASPQTSATYGSFDGEKASEQYLIPDDIQPDSGEVSVVLSPSVISALEGAFVYMRDYPYVCWEQVLTKGVMAAHYKELRDYLSKAFKWEKADSIPQATLELAQSFQAPNGGMTYYVARDEYVDPYLSAYTAIAFNWLRRDGHQIPEAVESKLHSYLLTLLRKDILPDFYSQGMASSVRAVALAALAENGKVTQDDIARHIDAIPQMSLFGKAHLLLAMTYVEGETENIKKLTQVILGQSNETGGKLMFNEAIDTVDFQRILTTPLRDNCAVLTALIAAGARGDTANMFLKENSYKLVRSISQTRKNRDHWENTQENMFCMSALKDYARTFESQKPDGTWVVQFAGQKLGQARFYDFRNEPVTLAQPVKPEELGKNLTLEIIRNGLGRMYYAARLGFAPLETAKGGTNAGIEVRREYSVQRAGGWQLLSSPFEIRRGELVRVDLYVSIPSARNFVVVKDPVPGGLEPVNRELATASTVDADQADKIFAGGSYWYRYNDWWDFATSRWSFYHKELRHDSVRFYSEYLPPGNYHLSYAAQAIAVGNFTVLPLHSEEMYDPDVFGEGAGEALVVGAQ